MIPIFDHHIHMDGRSADDYELMAVSGVSKVLVPCSATNERRHSGASFGARFDKLIGFERERASRYAVELFVGLSVHAADMADHDGALVGIEEVDHRLGRSCVRAVGELALRRFSEEEIDVFERQLELASRRHVPAMVESPPAMDAFERLLAVLEGVFHRGTADPATVCLMDLDKEKLKLATDLGFGGYGLPVSPLLDGLFRLRDKLTHAEILEVLDNFGPDRLMLNTGFHFGSADPLGLAKTVLRLRIRGVSDEILRALAHDNAARLFDAPAT